MLETHVARTILELRSWQPECRSGARAVTVNGSELPRQTGVTLPGALRVLCVAPGEWMLVSAEPLTGDFVERIAADARAQGAVLIDGTDGMGVLRVQGAHAREVLSKGCGLDFHPDAFPVGRCARTRFAQIPLLIEHIDAGPTFHCYVARSYLRYLVDWIEDAAVEFDPSPLLGYRP